MACPEKREEPYYVIHLFEMYRHIFPSYHIESIKTVLYVWSTIIWNLLSYRKAAAYTKVDKIMKII